MTSDIHILDVQPEDLQAIGTIFYRAMAADFPFLNIYPPTQRPTVDVWARMYADEEAEVFEKERRDGLRFVKVRGLWGFYRRAVGRRSR
jgi:hypothetical protein